MMVNYDQAKYLLFEPSHCKVVYLFHQMRAVPLIWLFYEWPEL